MFRRIIFDMSGRYSYSPFLPAILPATVAKLNGENIPLIQAATGEWLSVNKKTQAFTFSVEFSPELEKIMHWLAP